MSSRQALADRLRAARLARGLTQAEVARALGLHRPAISEIEAGRRSVSSDELVELSRALSVPLADLLPGAVPSVPGPADADATAHEQTILAMVRTIVEQFDPEQVILFGSHARGAAGADSDVDLLVVMDVSGSRRRMGARIGAALHGFSVPKDIIVTTPEAFRTRREVPGTIERLAAREGRVLHGAA